MNIDEADRFDPERLAKWLQVSREYLFAPLAESRCEAAAREISRLPSTRDRRGRNTPYSLTCAGAAPWAWLIALGCAMLPVTSPAAEPLALKGIMKDMGRNMQVIVDGISREDYAAVEKAALAIADHPQPPLGEKMRILGFVGGNTPRFKAFDGETHDHATALAKALNGANGEDAIAAFQKLQSSCLACHQTFRKPFQEHFYGKAETR